MTEVTSRFGTPVDLEVDVDAICAYEAEHPDWSLYDLLQKAGKIRITDYNLLATFVGYRDYATFAAKGLTIEHLGKAMEDFTVRMGFMEPESGLPSD